MRSLLWSLRTATVAAVVFGLTLLFANGQSLAVPLPFDYTTGMQTTVATITGTGGTMNFTLDVDDPTLTDQTFSGVNGSFSMDVLGPGDVILGSISLAGAPYFDGLSQDFGSIATPPVPLVPVLPIESMWSLTVGAPDLPLSLEVTSYLFNLFGPLTYTPVLTVEFTGNLALTSPNAVPLPATLPLFASGLGVLGLLGWRRKRKNKAARVAT